MNICHDKTLTCVFCGKDYRATSKMQKWKYHVCSRECGIDYVKNLEIKNAQTIWKN